MKHGVCMKKFNDIPSILITGASGFLGSEILKQVVAQSHNKISVISSQCYKINKTYPDQNNLFLYDYEDLTSNKISWENIDIIINCSFARSNDSSLLAQSLDFTEQLLLESRRNKIGGFINISSQSLYGHPSIPPWDENSPVLASSLYAMAKYATEIMTRTVFCDSITETSNYTNIRLSSLSGPGFDARLSSKFVQSALLGKEIRIKGGQQVISYMDIRDAAEGIIRLSGFESSKWKSLYNFGSPWSYTLIEIAETVKKMAAAYTDNTVEIIIENQDSEHLSGMNSNLLYNDLGWKPTHNIESMVKSLFEFYSHNT